jgi:DNA topoisomerase-1
MSAENLLVVESPAKAKTITKYLGNKFTVLSSRGHVRSIPSRSNAVDTEHQFETEYEINVGSGKYLDAITDAAKKATNIYMATDPDREGEAIAWHVLEVLKDRKVSLDDKVQRITFNEVTPDAIKSALKSPRDIDMDLVSAQRTRQSLDYLVGFSVSPLLWKKLPGSKSAGRVQSVALRLLCEREHEIMRFKSIDYWTISACFGLNSDQFISELIDINTQKVEKFAFTSDTAAKSIVNILKDLNYSVDSIEKKEVSRNPEPPFITSTLIQSASSALKMSAKKTMQVAQKLYEGMKIDDQMIGLITYMRTDSINVSEESIDKARKVIKQTYGDKYLPKEPRIFKKKVKNAQEAHEAIRPTDPSIIPSQIKEFLTDDEFHLYDLIWRRFIGCQMSSVKVAKTTIKIIGKSDKQIDLGKLDESVKSFFESQNNTTASFKVIGTIILFDGFQKLVNDLQINKKKTDDDVILPQMSEGEAVNLIDMPSKKHSTTAPSRYSEATLVKKMEDLGIGRPSTYATIISILQERQYVMLAKNKFFVEDRGELVNTFLNCFFSRYVEYNFTASLEKELDDIAGGDKKSLDILRGFWEPFKKNVDEVGQMQTSDILLKIQNILSDFLFANLENHKCPKCKSGDLKLKNSKYSPFIGCSNYPECDYAQKFKLYSSESKGETTADSFLKNEDSNDNLMIHSGNIKVIAQDGDEHIMLNQGQYGHYLSLCKDGIVQKNFSINKGVDIEAFNFEFADLRKFFNMPFALGKHTDGNEIKIGIGRYGPYILHKKKFYSIKNKDMAAILAFTLDEAVNLISGKK